MGWMPALHAESPKVYRGDASHLPIIDPKKVYEVKTFRDSNKEFETRTLEMDAAKLPDYHGNWKTLPMKGWSSPKSDIYPRSLVPRDFAAKKAREKWSRQAPMDHLAALPADEVDLDSRQVESKPNVKTEDLPTPPDIAPEELKLLINRGIIKRGREAGKVQLGRGFGAVELRPDSPEVYKTKAAIAPPGTGAKPASSEPRPRISLAFPE